MNTYLILSTLSGVVALLFAFVLSREIGSADSGNPRIREIA